MKLITAIIPPERLEATKDELGKVKISRMTVVDVQGLSDAPAQASGASAAERYGAGAPSTPVPASLVKLMIAVNEDFVEPTIHAILRAAEIKDASEDFGRVFVLPLEEVVRVRTGERGPAAI